jgi:hypothetical protein
VSVTEPDAKKNGAVEIACAPPVGNVRSATHLNSAAATPDSGVVPRPKIPDYERNDVERELTRHLTEKCHIPEPASLIADALDAMRRAPAAAAAVKTESMALKKLTKPLGAWLKAHEAAEVFRDHETHAGWDVQRTNAKLAATAKQLHEAEIARREELPRAEALESAATLQSRGFAPTVQWFITFAVTRGFDVRALVLLEAFALARGVTLRPRGVTYWMDRQGAQKDWDVLVRHVLPKLSE